MKGKNEKSVRIDTHHNTILFFSINHDPISFIPIPNYRTVKEHHKEHCMFFKTCKRQCI